MDEINRLLLEIKIATIIRNISFVIMIASLAVIITTLIKGKREHKPFGIFDYYFEYFDEKGNLIKRERISKEQYKKAPKKAWIDN